MMQPTKLTKSTSLITVISLMFITMFVFGIGLVWSLQLLGLGQYASGAISSQISILLLGFALYSFDMRILKSELTKKMNIKSVAISILLTSIIFLILYILKIFSPNDNLPETTEQIVRSKSFLIGFIMPVIVAPIVEELTFRAGFKHALVDKSTWSTLAYVVISSIVFGLIHWEPGDIITVHVMLTGLMGVLLSISYIKTNNIYIPIVTHMIYNFLVITIVKGIL